jgi:hypothetical protein
MGGSHDAGAGFRTEAGSAERPRVAVRGEVCLDHREASGITTVQRATPRSVSKCSWS